MKKKLFEEINKDVFNELRMEELKRKINQTIMTDDSISNHLLELRSRLLKVIALFAALFGYRYSFAADIYEVIALPLNQLLPVGSTMIATEVSSPFMAPLKLVLYLALLLTMPWLFYQTWTYVSPGLRKNEEKFAGPLMLSTIILFFNGVCFAFMWFVQLFLSFIGMAPDSILVLTDINQYLNFIFKLFLLLELLLKFQWPQSC